MDLYCGCRKVLEGRTIDPSWIGGEVDGTFHRVWVVVSLKRGYDGRQGNQSLPLDSVPRILRKQHQRSLSTSFAEELNLQKDV